MMKTQMGNKKLLIINHPNEQGWHLPVGFINQWKEKSALLNLFLNRSVFSLWAVESWGLSKTKYAEYKRGATLTGNTVQTKPSSHGGGGREGVLDYGFKGKKKVWCCETTFCYFYPLDIIIKMWMTEGVYFSQLVKAKMFWLYLLQRDL